MRIGTNLTFRFWLILRHCMSTTACMFTLFHLTFLRLNQISIDHFNTLLPSLRLSNYLSLSFLFHVLWVFAVWGVIFDQKISNQVFKHTWSLFAWRISIIYHLFSQSLASVFRVLNRITFNFTWTYLKTAFIVKIYNLLFRHGTTSRFTYKA